MEAVEKTVCAECGKEIVPDSPHTTGYGVNVLNEKICYACCADHDKNFMEEEEGRITLYLTMKAGANTVSNWPGSLKFSAHVRTGRHNIAGRRYDAWFTDHLGKKWHGVQYGNNTQLIHCQRLKG